MRFSYRINVEDLISTNTHKSLWKIPKVGVLPLLFFNSQLLERLRDRERKRETEFRKIKAVLDHVY